MKINLGKWGVPIGALFTALSTIVSDSVLEANDAVTLVLALIGLAGTVAAGVKAYNSEPEKKE